MGIYISGICDFSLGGRIDAMDLGGSQGLEFGECEFFGKSVDSGVLKKLVSGFVNIWCVCVALEISRSGDLAREVFARVEELEEASDGIQIFVNKVNSAFLVGMLESVLRLIDS